jgi:hypothetical protein
MSFVFAQSVGRKLCFLQAEAISFACRYIQGYSQAQHPALWRVHPLTEPEIAQDKKHNDNNADNIEEIHTSS